MKPRCPYYIPPRYYVDSETDIGYEGSAMCDLADASCLVEYGNRCETYNDFLDEDYEEWARENAERET